MARRSLRFAVAVSLLLGLLYLVRSFHVLIGLIPMDACPAESAEQLIQDNREDAKLDLGSRRDVQTCTSWGAPILWEGMFDPRRYDQLHLQRGSSVALIVFAVGKYLEAYLRPFLDSAECHFMPGLPGTYYVLTDAPQQVPAMTLAENRVLRVLLVERHRRWQDVSMMRMKSIVELIESEVRHTHTHVFCMDVDQEFAARFGSEALGESVALLHAYYYHLPRSLYTYEHSPLSAACMEAGAGDFYYHAAVFGGTWQHVKALAEACHRGIMADKAAGVEALWHDESHLNRYLWLHKPSRLLSPEYGWDPLIGYRPDIRRARLLWGPKRYHALRV